MLYIYIYKSSSISLIKFQFISVTMKSILIAFLLSVIECTWIEKEPIRKVLCDKVCNPYQGWYEIVKCCKEQSARKLILSKCSNGEAYCGNKVTPYPQRATSDCQMAEEKNYGWANRDLGNNNIEAVIECFNRLRKQLENTSKTSGCFKDIVENCRCSVSSNKFDESKMKTFEYGVKTNKVESKNFKSVEAEAFNRSMYVSYSC